MTEQEERSEIAAVYCFIGFFVFLGIAGVALIIEHYARVQ